MPQKYCSLKGLPKPFAVVRGASASTFLRVVASATSPLQVIWQDGATDSYGDGTVTPTVDSRATVWLLIAVQGGGLRWVREQDRGTIDTVIGGTNPQRAILGRLDGALFYRVPQ